jgi:glucans biosynthesis protein
MLLAVAANPTLAGAGGVSFGASTPFTFDDLVAKARKMAAKAYAPRMLPQWTSFVLDEIDYDQHGHIHNARSKGLFAATDSPITFFHLGRLFRKPVRLFTWEDGNAREVLYSKDIFTYERTNPAARMPDDAGFAGFRILGKKKADVNDWCAFLGASYFRCAGDGAQYGASARAVAIDTAPSSNKNTEEFPDFSCFWIEPFENETGRIMALLDGPSLTGAYIFTISRRPNVEMHVDCALFPRRKVERFGIAAPTSMYWYSKTNRWEGQDMRPEVHDSDGLAIHNGAGEMIWRPLNNPPRLMRNAFVDENPKGFGLIQRERRFDAYDDRVGFQKRHNVWIEPTGNWGRGGIQLIEIPTPDEYLDNIVCMWSPERTPEPSDELRFSYDIFWSVNERRPRNLATCVATRLNKGSYIPVKDRKPGEPAMLRSIAVEFEGEALEGLDPSKAEIVLSLSRGVAPRGPEAAEYGIWPRADGSLRQWRVIFSVHSDGDDPIDIRLFLRYGERTLTETWLYQLHPGQYVIPAGVTTPGRPVIGSLDSVPSGFQDELARRRPQIQRSLHFPPPPLTSDATPSR